MDYRPHDLGDLLSGPELRGVVRDIAELGVAAYRQNVRVRTGRNRREVRSFTRMGGNRLDRWVGVVLAYAPHGLAREFGNKRTPAPDEGLENALRMLGSL